MAMPTKTVILQESTRVLLNEAKGRYLYQHSKVKRVSDDNIIKMALLEYVNKRWENDRRTNKASRG